MWTRPVKSILNTLNRRIVESLTIGRRPRGEDDEEPSSFHEPGTPKLKPASFPLKEISWKGAGASAAASASQDEQCSLVLCTQCANIDFKAAFSVRAPSRKGIAVTPLLRLGLESCDFCKMVGTMLDDAGVSRTDYEVEGFHLSAYQSLGILKLLPSRKFESVTTDNALIIVRGPPDNRLLVNVYGILLGAIVPLANPHCTLSDKHFVYRGRLIEKRSIDFDLLRFWLDDCNPSNKESHDKCHDMVDITPPNICVIDTATRDIVPLPRTGTEIARYLCLSYVWGQPDIKASGAEHKSGMPIRLPPVVPQTVEDAISVVKGLNERYLWVDQYCIADVEHKEEILVMDAIYNRAFVTIVAVEGEDYHAGICGISTRPRQHQPSCFTSAGMLVSTGKPLAASVESSKWGQRGWTYQEGLLSRRCLFFTASQVWIACPSKVESEAAMICYVENGQVIQDLRVNNAGLDPVLFSTENQQRVWRGFYRTEPRNLFEDIMAYSSRDLTFPSDAMDAFRGILARSPVRSYWGVPIYPELPVSDTDPCRFDDTVTVRFMLGLSWFTAGDILHRKQIVPRKGFPSWSWLSTPAPVAFNEPLRTYLRSEKVPKSDISIFVSLESAPQMRISFNRLASSHTSTIIPAHDPYLYITGPVAPVEISEHPAHPSHPIINCPVHADTEGERLEPRQVVGWLRDHVGRRIPVYADQAGGTPTDNDINVHIDGTFHDLMDEQSRGVKFCALRLLDIYLLFKWRDGIAYRFGMSTGWADWSSEEPKYKNCGCTVTFDVQTIKLG